MSWEQIRLAWAAPCVSVSQRCLLLALADYSDAHGGSVFPSQLSLASKACLSDRHVRTVLGELIGLGLLKVTTPAAGKRPTAYTLVLPPIPEASSTRKPLPVGNDDRKSQHSRPELERILPEATSDNPLRIHSETQEKSAGARASPTGALPAQTQERTPEQRAADRQALLDIAAKIRAEPGANGARRPGATLLAKPVTLTEDERQAEIARRRRQLRELFEASVSSATSTAKE